jgi:hypothetical protein
LYLVYRWLLFAVRLKNIKKKEGVCHFQGRNEQGKMNAKSEDETYTRLITDLRDKLKIPAKKIEPKVYEYGFLKS